jgi:hypothetical protein
LLLVSAGNVVVGVKTGGVGVGAEETGVDELPQPTSKAVRPATVARLKVCRARLDFTGNYSIAVLRKRLTNPDCRMATQLAENFVKFKDCPAEGQPASGLVHDQEKALA